MSKDWKEQSPDTLRKEVGRLVHFSAKTVNSNAQTVAIRLTPEAALDLPYVSLRTLLGSGVDFRLDYAEGGAASAGPIKHVNWVLTDAPEAAEASEVEKRTIREAMKEATSSPYHAGTEHVDHRLRQILVPKEDAEEGYVALTPITSSSLCAYLFDAQGLVTEHNAAVKADPNGPKKRLCQAQFGIGGSNPQNIGSLVRAMQRPLFLDAPRSSGSLRKAYALYYKGIEFNVHSAGSFKDVVMNYVDFRKKVLLAEQSITMQEREHEKNLIQAIAAVILDMAAEASAALSESAQSLPQETWLPHASPPRHAWVSPNLPEEIQGLLDPEQRSLCDNWPRSMAQSITSLILQSNKSGERLLLLDASARAHMERLIEEALV